MFGMCNPISSTRFQLTVVLVIETQPFSNDKAVSLEREDSYIKRAGLLVVPFRD